YSPLGFERKVSALPKSPTGRTSPAAIVDGLNALAGDRPGARVSFAEGRCVRGTYAPSEQARQITRSRSFTRPSRVLARFSLDGGNQAVTGTGYPVLRGFTFRLGSDGQRSEIFTQSAPVHVASTPEQMLAFLKVRIPGPDGRVDAGKVEAFSAANPETL